MKKFLITEKQLDSLILLKRKMQDELPYVLTQDDCLSDICDDISDILFKIEEQEIANEKTQIL
jgi:hypothetical protein